MAKVYEGERPYIFVSYAHADDKFVMRVIDELDSAGYRVWYDQGIPWSDNWTNTIATHVHACSRFLAFVSKAFAESDYCTKEVGLASEFKRRMLVAYIEDFDLFQVNPGMHFNVNQSQAIFLDRFESDEAFVASIVNESVLEPCLREDARARNNAVKTALDVLSRFVDDDDALQNALYALRGLPDSVQNDTVRQCVSQIENRLRELAAEREKAKQQEAREKAIGVARVALKESRDDERALKDALSTLRVLPETVRDEAVERYASQLEDRLRQLEDEQALREQMERERRDAIQKASDALYTRGDDERALRDALNGLYRLPNLARDHEAEQLAARIDDRLAELEENRRRREREARAYRTAVDAAWSALNAPEVREHDLQDALAALRDLPDTVRDQMVDRCTSLIESRLHRLEADREERERLEREAARRRAIGSSRAALDSPGGDEAALREALSALNGLPGADSDPEVQRLIERVHKRLDELEAIKAAEREERIRRQRQEVRERAINAARAALDAPDSDMHTLKRTIDSLCALPDTGDDQDVKQLVNELASRVNELEAAKPAKSRKSNKPKGIRRPPQDPSSKSKANAIAIAASVVAVIIAIVIFAIAGSDGSGTDTSGGSSSTSSTTSTTTNTTKRTSSSGSSTLESSSTESNAATELEELLEEPQSDTTSQTTDSSANSLSDYSWPALKEIANEIAAADSDKEGLEIARSYGLVEMVDSDYVLNGDTKTIKLNDEDGTEAEVRIAGFRHDDRADGKGKAGITFEFANVPKTHVMNSTFTNKGGWEKSGMRTYLNGDFLKLLPENLQSNIVEVVKHTNNAGYVENAGNTSVVTDTKDKLWLLSMCEVYGKNITRFNGDEIYSLATYQKEGTQYLLYKSQGVTTTNYGFCEKSGARSVWWLRSPNAHYSGSFRSVNPDGDWDDGGLAGYGLGVSPGFCF